jgi:thiol-disulfide isomerase/thioredoxin
MKNQLINLFLFLLLGCKSNTQEWSTIEVSGKIENDSIKSIKFYPLETLADYIPNLQIISLNKEGNFSLKYALKRPTNAMLIIDGNRYMVFIEPGKNISLKYSDNQSIEFIEEYKKNNTLFFKYQQKFSPFFSSSLKYNIDPEQFKIQVDSITREKYSFLESNKDNLSKDFVDYLAKDIQYYSAKEKIYYARRYSTGLIKESNNYFDFLDSIVVQEDHASNVYNYLEFIDSYINYLYVKKLWSVGVDFKNDYIEKYYIAKSKLTGEPLEQFLTENFVLGLQSPLINDTLVTIITNYISGNYSEMSKNIIKQKMSRLKESPISIGKMAPDFSLNNPNNHSFSLSDFKKEYIILDFWASWCGPCRKAIPEMKLLSEKYIDKVQVVFISIDNNINDWKKATNELQIPEPSLVIDDKSRAEYGFMDNVAVPYYIVLDNTGKIILSNTTIEDILTLLEN